MPYRSQRRGPRAADQSLDLMTLRVAACAADCGSISAAGERMGLAVAAASTRISALEEQLGLQLFERSSRGVRPTLAGQMLLRRGRELIADADRLACELRDWGRGQRGHVRLLANTSALLEVLPERLARCQRVAPHIQVEVEERASPAIAQALLEGCSDLGVVDLPSPPSGLQLHPFFRDTLVLVVPHGHALCQRPSLRLADALDQPFITLRDGTALSNRLRAVAAAAGAAVRVRMQVLGFDGVCRMVAGGLGVGLLPMESVVPQMASLPILALPLAEEWASRTHYIAVPQQGERTPAVKTVLRLLLQK